jgi:hypothetical protein
LGEVRDVVGAEDHIDMGELLDEARAVTLADTAADGYDAMVGACVTVGTVLFGVTVVTVGTVLFCHSPRSVTVGTVLFCHSPRMRGL